MFGIGFTEILLVGFVALVFIGPKRLPEVTQQFGKFFVKFRRATNDARQAVDQVLKDAERDIILEERSKLQGAFESIKSVAQTETSAITADVRETVSQIESTKLTKSE